MPDYVIGVDIGTGSTKALAVDFKGQVIFSRQAHYDTASPTRGYSEQDPESVWLAFATCIAGITAAVQANPTAIILSSAMHSVIPVSEDGLPLHPMIIWADNRSADIARRIRQSAAGEMLYKQTGTPIHAMSPLCKIAWLREHNATLFSKTAKFISIKEYIWFRIFKTFEADHSIASATGLMDIERLAWSDTALNIAGIRHQQLSSLVSTTYGRTDGDPEVCARLGVHRTTRFIAGASDGCLANLGSFATAPGIAALTIGTSGAVRVASKTPVHNFSAMTFNYRLDEQTLICGGPSNNGGVALKWFVESFLQKKLVTQNDYDAILNTITHTSAGAEGLIFLPYLFGERAPVWNSEASGLFFGIKGMHTQPYFTRAVIEGISMALYDIAENMIRSGMPISQVHVSGGFVKSSVWLQVLANVFNKKICLINADDASAMGAAYLGLRSLEIISDHNALMPATMKEILPQRECVDLYQHNFQTYRSLYNNLKGMMVS
jgi:gluconokinase